MGNWRSLAVLGLGGVVAGGAMLAAISQGAADADLPWDDPEAVAEGRALYAEYCASCHGDRLEGAPDWQRPGPGGLMPAPPHDATGHTWHHPTGMLVAITKHGSEAVIGGGYESAMNGFGDVMTDAEIRAVLGYIKSTWPPDIREAHDAIDARAR